MIDKMLGLNRPSDLYSLWGLYDWRWINFDVRIDFFRKFRYGKKEYVFFRVDFFIKLIEAA